MAPGDMVPDHAKQLKPKDKRSGGRPLEGECEPDGSFVFEAHEAWKDFHNSLRQFYEVGELCDVTLKVGRDSLGTRKERERLNFTSVASSQLLKVTKGNVVCEFPRN